MSALRSLPLLSLAVAASCALVGGRAEGDDAARARAAERTPTTKAPEATYDLAAIDTWSQLHQDGIELAELAARRSTREDIRTYAQRGIREANGDREALSAWRVDWFGDAPRALSGA